MAIFHAEYANDFQRCLTICVFNPTKPKTSNILKRNFFVLSFTQKKNCYKSIASTFCWRCAPLSHKKVISLYILKTALTHCVAWHLTIYMLRMKRFIKNIFPFYRKRNKSFVEFFIRKEMKICCIRENKEIFRKYLFLLKLSFKI